MMTVFVGRAMANSVIVLASSVKKLRRVVEVWANKGQTEFADEESERAFVRLDVYVTREELRDIISHPPLRQAWERAAVLKDTGVVPLCPQCGSVCTS